ncbi:hypothetical protein [Stygiolobus caldivivus]|uniref:Uncharacterized protein n=1 Tax=Stygiolobus caldivivus TaxID=2824673 RepID=A0A8D5U3Z1_9CREN|nr:hypothetical protein [Stygiolobus caldivivus]BCU68838.1 hypothetical protein KN1_01350 [Stygiolobus caldivivus]
MSQLAVKLLEMAEIEKDLVVKLSALLECVEDLVEVDDSSPDFKKRALEEIRKDKELYEVYEEIIDAMFELVINGSSPDIDKIILDVKKRMVKAGK